MQLNGYERAEYVDKAEAEEAARFMQQTSNSTITVFKAEPCADRLWGVLMSVRGHPVGRWVDRERIEATQRVQAERFADMCLDDPFDPFHDIVGAIRRRGGEPCYAALAAVGPSRSSSRPWEEIARDAMERRRKLNGA